MRGNRAAETLVGAGGDDRADETLARGADQYRQAERLQRIDVGETDDALLRRLAKADTRIEHDAVASNARGIRDLERAGEEGLHIRHDVDAGIGGIPVVHDDYGGVMLGDNARH